MIKGKNLMRSNIAVILLLFLICSNISALTADKIEENVDLSNLKSLKIRLHYSFPPGYVDTLTNDVLQERCDSLTTVATCSPSLDVENNQVSFTVLRKIELQADEISIRGSDVKLGLIMSYAPIQYSLSTGILAKTRELSFIYPTHKTVIQNLRDVYYSTTFFVRDKKAKEIPIRNVKSNYELGEEIEIPKIDGDICVYALMKGKDVILKEISLDCDGFRMGTNSFLDPGSYRVYVFAIKSPKITFSSYQIHLKQTPFGVNINTESKTVPLGETLDLDIVSNKNIDSCEVSLIDKFGNTAVKNNYDSCDDLVVGTSSSWPPGKYLLKADVKSDGKSSSATKNIELEGLNLAPVETMTDKEVYTAGEDIEVNIEADGDFCKTEILDGNYVPVAESESRNCDNTKLELDSSLDEGTYVVKTEVIEDGKVKAISSKGIEVKKWTSQLGTAKSDMCQQGFMYLFEHKLTCLSEGEICIPSSSSIPICLCFNKKEDIVDTCEYGHLCQRTDCRRRTVDSPYLIVFENYQCIAKRGTEALPCIRKGELCSGTCVCINDQGNPLSSCTINQLCTESGCQDSHLQFQFKRIEPDHARVDDLKKGIAISWKGLISLDDIMLSKDYANDLEASCVIGNKEAEKTDIKFASEKDGWEIKCYFKYDITPTPREEEIMLILSHKYKGYTHVLRRPFNIWYTKTKQNLRVQMSQISPAQLTIADVKYGASLDFRVLIKDSEGMPVSNLPPHAFKVDVGKTRARSVSAIYDKMGKTWKVSANMLSKNVGASNSIECKIDYLGRYGSDRKPFDVVEKIPLSMKIDKISPGAPGDPLFYSLIPMGFKMDVFVQIKGADNLKKGNFKVEIGEYDVSEQISYVVSTLQGIRINLMNVKLCPNPPPPNTLIPVKVTVSQGADIVSDEQQIQISGNPGNWENIKESDC